MVAHVWAAVKKLVEIALPLRRNVGVVCAAAPSGLEFVFGYERAAGTVLGKSGGETALG